MVPPMCLAVSCDGRNKKLRQDIFFFGIFPTETIEEAVAARPDNAHIPHCPTSGDLGEVVK